MKIANIEQFRPRPRTRLVKVTTDEGLVGWGETTLEGKPKSTWASVEELAEYLIGRDPLRTPKSIEPFSEATKDLALFVFSPRIPTPLK